MAFVQRKVLSGVPKAFQLARYHSARQVEKSVFISQSNDVFTNLALEEWLNTNFKFDNHHVMLYYKNNPTVVLGNEENPWLDTNIATRHENQECEHVALARRQGSGTAIYQDQGMMNMTFFGPSSHLNKEYNMGVISRAIFRKYGMKIQKDQDNLTFYNMKVSGSGATVGDDNSYQNCSLFVDVNKSDLLCALEKGQIARNDNEPTKQCYLNMSEIDSRANSDGLLSAIGWEFMRTSAYSLKDGGKTLAEKQRGFQMINPTEKWFPGITEIRDKLVNWEWCYGKTPKFQIFRSFPVPAQFLNSTTDHPNELRIKLQVANGRISDVTLFVPPGLSSSGFTGEAKVVTGLKGQRFTEEALAAIESNLGINNYVDEKEKFVTECVRQAMCI